MHRKIYLRRYLCLIIMLSILLSTALSSTYTVKAADEEYKTFSQLDDRWGDVIWGGYDSLRSSGCFITAISVLMAYANPDLRDVNKWNPGIASGKFDYAGGLISSSVVNADPTFTKYADVDTSGGADAVAKIKKYYDEGYYVTVCASGYPITSSTHFTPVVGWNKETDKPILMDVAGGAHPNWEDWEPVVNDIDVFASSLNKSYDVMGNASKVQENAPKTEKERQELQQMISEMQLVGMEDADHKISAEQKELYLLKATDINLVEKKSVASIQESMSATKMGINEKIHIGFSLIGLLLMVYGVFLGLAYIFDKVNNFIDIGLLKVISFGKLATLNSFDEEKSRRVNGTLYCNGGRVTMAVVVVEVFGILFLNGWFLNIISSIVYYIMTKIV